MSHTSKNWPQILTKNYLIQSWKFCSLVSSVCFKIIHWAYIRVYEQVLSVTSLTSSSLAYSLICYVMYCCCQFLQSCHHSFLWPGENPSNIEAMFMLKYSWIWDPGKGCWVKRYLEWKNDSENNSSILTSLTSNVYALLYTFRTFTFLKHSSNVWMCNTGCLS